MAKGYTLLKEENMLWHFLRRMLDLACLFVVMGIGLTLASCTTEDWSLQDPSDMRRSPHYESDYGWPSREFGS